MDGTCSHLFLYIKGEWHLMASYLLRVYLLLSVLMLSLQGVYHHSRLQPAIADAMILIGAYAMALFVSMTIYRVSFPLSQSCG